MAGTQMQLEDWLDDLCVRFIINLPEEDLSSVARICFQVEEAQWFYEDFIRPLDPTLPSMSLRTFCLRIFQHCPLLANFSVENHTKAFEEFLEYKTRVPVRGAILLNEAMDSTVLVKGWKKGANWSFPRGKINKDEDDLDCAIREVYEETGLDLNAAGLVPTEAKPKYIEISMREQHMRLYVFRDVPMDTVFEPKTRKEISKIQWYKLSELPAFRKKGGNNESHAVPNANKFYMVAPFLPPLKKWVVSQKKIEARRVASGNHVHGYKTIDEVHPEDEWTQTDTGAETSTQTPAIETLAGATQELQRLLKVQPPTQGIQPAPPQDDKGSALLSILQAGPASQRGTQLPRTLHDLTGLEASQSQNPHHQNNSHQVPSINTQQPPASFPLSLNQGQWTTAQMQPRNDSAIAQQFPIAPQQHYGSNQATLIHPQPLPPQVQRSVFNRSVFQEGSQPNYMGSCPNPQQTQYGASSQGPLGQMPPHVPMPLDNPRPAQLDGQSIALLNAFKSGSTNSQLKENASHSNPPIAVPGSTGQNYVQPYGYSGMPHNLAQTIGQQRSQPSPKELAGSKVGTSADDHRSALLGMFRKADPGANGPQVHHDSGYSNVGKGTSGNMLNDLLRSAGTGSSMRNKGPSRSSVDTNPSLSLDSLSVHPRPMQSTTPGSQGRVDYTSQYGSQPQPSQPTQPLRILQRVQNEQFYGANAPMVVSPQTSPQEMGGHPPPGHVPSPGMMVAYPSQGALNRRPESGADQKRQLLSLFGKQESPGLEAGKGKEVVAEAPPSRVPSLVSGAGELAVPQPSASRRGSQTPISPADRSFLLGYLESVTNNATR